MTSAPADGTTLAYEAVGRGPTCLVLPGWVGADHTYLRPGLDVLGDRLRLVFLDHRGTGRSGRPDLGTLTLEQLADDAAALAGHLGGERVLVLGHHHGGFVAQELALRHPARVAGLVLVATTPGELGMQESLLDALGPPLPVEVDVLQRVAPATDEEARATLEALTRFFLARPDGAGGDGPFGPAVVDAATMGRWMQVTGAWSAVDRLGDVRAPALVIAGRHDVLCPPEQAARLERRLPAARLAVLEDSGHLPWLEEPEAFVDCVAGWLDEVAAGD